MVWNTHLGLEHLTLWELDFQGKGLEKGALHSSLAESWDSRSVSTQDSVLYRVAVGTHPASGDKGIGGALDLGDM